MVKSLSDPPLFSVWQMSKAYEFSSNFMYLRLDFDLKITTKKSSPITDEEEIKFPFGRSRFCLNIFSNKINEVRNLGSEK